MLVLSFAARPDALRSRPRGRSARRARRGLQAAGPDRRHDPRGGRGRAGCASSTPSTGLVECRLAGREPARPVGRCARRSSWSGDAPRCREPSTALADAAGGQATARDGRAHTRLDRVRRRRAGAAGGRRGGADRLRAHAPDDRAGRRAAAGSARSARARREQRRRTSPRSELFALGRVDGALHAIAFAPGDAFGGDSSSAPPESAEIAFRTSPTPSKPWPGPWPR